MPDVSYLITYRNSGAGRKENLAYILTSLATLPRLEVILIEQDEQQHIQDKMLPANCRYSFAWNPGEFNKSWGLNLTAKLARSRALIMADVDMLLTLDCLEQIIVELNNGADAVNPYSILVDLHKKETQALYNGQTVLNIERSEQQLNRFERGHQLPFCGGIFAVSVDLFNRAGGFDERFEGWGAEDDAMSMRIEHFALNAVTLTGLSAYHLWHEPVVTVDTAANPQYLRNLALLSAYHEYGDKFYKNLAVGDAQHHAQPEKYSKSENTNRSAKDPPLISCLCVTRARPETLQQAITCFKHQTHRKTELVIVCEDDDAETLAFIETLADSAIRTHVVASKPRSSLGELRNHAIRVAHGEYICQWDDDDWYHPRRLELQLKSAIEQNKAASILPRWLIYSRHDQRAYCSNIRLWEGSLLCEKSLLLSGPGYPALSKGEDTALISWLYIQDQLAIEDRPDLYVYIHSGSNTWNQQHFQHILNSSTLLNAIDTQRIRTMISQ